MANPSGKRRESEFTPGNADSSPPGREQLQHLENQPSENPTSNRTTAAEMARDGAGITTEHLPTHENQVGRGYVAAARNGLRSKLSSMSGQKKALYGLGAGGTVAGIAIGVFFSLLNLQLPHIKNVFYKEIGGVQSRVYQLGRERYYSRMFFFDKEGDFSGYKDTTIRGMMYKNRQTKRLVEVLERNGYRVEFEKIGTTETGKVRALHRIDRQGKIIPGQSITNEKMLTSAWDIKKNRNLQNILQTVYPEESARWHGRQAKKLNKRWGLTRTNWISEYLREKSGVAALERKELIFRAALRQHLFGNGTINGVAQSPKPTEEEKKNNPAAQTLEQLEKGNDGLAERVIEDAEKLRQEQLSNINADNPNNVLGSIEDGVTKNLSPDELLATTRRAIPNGVVNSLNALYTVQTACAGKGALNSVVIGARVLRSAQLMKFGMSVLNIADAVQDGKAVRSNDVAIMMSYLNSKDADGKSMFSSSGWRYWTNENVDKNNFTFSKFDQEERNKYAVGGGFTGTLASIDATLNKFAVGNSCEKANGALATIGGFVVGIGAGIFSGGTFTVANAVTGISLEVVKSIALSIAVDFLTPIAAGTVVNGAEKGTAIGNSLVSGFEVLSNANGANAGMKPLTSGEYSLALSEYETYQDNLFASLPLSQRLFSTDYNQSLTMSAYASFSQFSLSGFIRNPLASIGASFGGIFSKPIGASGAGNGCTDPSITDRGLAATPFCTVIVGIPKSMIDDPQYYPDVVEQKMLDGGYVDADGTPKGGTDYEKYLKQCTSDGVSEEGGDYRSIDIVHEANAKGGSTDTDICYKNPLFYMYRFYTYIGQTENDGLNGTNITDASDVSVGVSDASSASDSTVQVPGGLKEVAAKILEAESAGRIVFNTLNSADAFAQSTPKDNISQAAAGQPSKTTLNCTGRGVAGRNPTATLNVNLLKFIYELSQIQKIQINSLVGQCHSSSSSNHYTGEAVDFGCPLDTASGDRIAGKYGIKRYDQESCSDVNAPHFHYSVGGN